MSEYYLVAGGERVGPLDADAVRRKLATGDANAETLAWTDGQADWLPLRQVAPELLAPARAADPPTRAEPAPAAQHAATSSAAHSPSPQAAAPIASKLDLGQRLPVVVQRCESHGTVFEVLRAEEKQMGHIVIHGDQVQIEGGAMHYMRGHIEITVPKPSAKNFLKAAATNEGIRPVYSGTGEIFLQPTTGEINLLELDGDSWVLDKGAFLAADNEVEVGVFVNKGAGGLLGGEGMFQTQVAGRGKVFYTSWGPVQRIELRNERLTVDGSFAVARSATLSFQVTKATKGLIASARSGEGLVNVIEGTGIVMLAPIANKHYVAMLGGP